MANENAYSLLYNENTIFISPVHLFMYGIKLVALSLPALLNLHAGILETGTSSEGRTKCENYGPISVFLFISKYSIKKFFGHYMITCLLEIHACSNPSPLTKSMQLYFRNYMKYLYRLLS